MSLQDPIADLLTRIRNAQMAGHKTVTLEASNFKVELCKLFKDEGYIHDYSLEQAPNKKLLTIVLKYYLGKPVIETIKRISRPGLRVYMGKSSLPRVQGGLGVAVISTPKGLMTDRNARANNHGGEVVCVVA